MADFGSRPRSRASWRSSDSAVAEPRAQSKHALAGRTILQIVPELQSGGAEQATIEIAEALAAIGARPLVASFGGRLVSELQAKGGIWYPFPAETKNPLTMFVNQRRLVDLIRAEDVALVHARSRAPAWVAYGATRTTGTPFVTTFHGAYSGTSGLKKSYNSVMAKGDVVIANSNFTAARIAHLYPSSRAKIRVIHRGVDLRAFSPDAVTPQRVQALRQVWGVAPGERIVLLAARLSPWKGHRILIEAARQLVGAGLANIKFILAGDEKTRGTYLKEVDAAIASAGLAGLVRRTGYCSDMPAALLASAVVVVPSTGPEAFGRVAAEAQAMGTPVVVSDLGALPEVVLAPPDVDAADRTGWRVTPGDARALATALVEALALGASARDELSVRARSRILDRFSVVRMQAETLDAYAALLAAPR